MTGKEVIYAVLSMTRGDRVRAQKSPDHALARVSQWPDAEPDAWRELLRDMGLVPVDASDTIHRMHRRVAMERLWRSRPWTDVDIAIACETTVQNVHVVRKRYFSAGPWQYSFDARGRRTSQLLEAA